ncbi:MAG: hypothetical protein WCK58_06950 [Chloroflexota bacterium]
MIGTTARVDGTVIKVFDLVELRETAGDERWQDIIEDAREAKATAAHEAGRPRHAEAIESLEHLEFAEQDAEEGWGYCALGCRIGNEDDDWDDAGACSHSAAALAVAEARG